MTILNIVNIFYKSALKGWDEVNKYFNCEKAIEKYSKIYRNLFLTK